MDYTTSVAYNYNETTKQYTKCYPLTHMNAVYTKDDESETLGNKLSDIDNAIDDNVNKIGVLNISMENVNTQLSHMEQQTSTNLNNIANIQHETRYSKHNSCKVSFVFDDCMHWDYEVLFPILQEKNVNIGIAVITDWVGGLHNGSNFATWEQIKEMSDAGNEILSHSIRQDVKYDTLTDNQLTEYFQKSRDTLREHGYFSDIIAYTWGTSDERVQRYARKFYRAGYGIFGENAVPNTNEITLNMYNIARVGLNGEDNPDANFPSDTDSLEYLKARVDYALARKQYLVFMGHSTMFQDTNKTKAQDLKDLIDYIRAKGIEILVPTEALRKVGNYVDVIALEDKTKYFKINRKFEIESNIFDARDMDAFNFDNVLKDFRLGTTVTSISTVVATSHAKSPSAYGGTLVTFRNQSNDLGYQTYVDVSGKQFIRNVINILGEFGVFEEITRYKKNITTIELPALTIPANSALNYTFNIDGVSSNDYNITIHFLGSMTHGVLFDYWITNNGTIVIRASNCTDSTKTTNVMSCKVIIA